MSNHNYYFIGVLFIITIYNSDIPDILVDGNLYIMNKLQTDTITTDNIFSKGNNIELNNLNFLGNVCMIGNDNYITNITINNLTLGTLNNHFLMIDPQSDILYIGNNSSPQPAPTTSDIQFLTTNEITTKDNILNMNTISGNTNIITNNLNFNGKNICFFGIIKALSNELFFNCNLALNSETSLNDLQTDSIFFNQNNTSITADTINFSKPITINNNVTLANNSFNTIECNGPIIIGSNLNDKIIIGNSNNPIKKIINIKDLSNEDNIWSYLTVNNDMSLSQNQLIEKIYQAPSTTNISSIGLYSNTAIKFDTKGAVYNQYQTVIIDSAIIKNIITDDCILECNNLFINNQLYNEDINFSNNNIEKITIEKINNQENSSSIHINSIEIRIPELKKSNIILPDSYFLTIDENKNIAIKNNANNENLEIIYIIKNIDNIIKKMINDNFFLKKKYTKILTKNNTLKNIIKKLEKILSTLMENSNELF